MLQVLAISPLFLFAVPEAVPIPVKCLSIRVILQKVSLMQKNWMGFYLVCVVDIPKFGSKRKFLSDISLASRFIHFIPLLCQFSYFIL